MSRKEYFNSYITGVFEASCSISIPIKKNRFPFPVFRFYFHKNNIALLEIIKNKIGHGTVCIRKAMAVYEITNKEGILNFIEITNKYLRTSKIHKYNEIIEYLKTYKNYNIPMAKIDESPLDSNSWLAGYLETNGSFQTLPNDLKKIKKVSQIYCNFTLNVQEFNKNNLSNESFMLNLASFIEGSMTKIKNLNKKLFSTCITNERSIYILYNYLQKYPLFGIQYLEAHDFFSISHLKYNSELTKGLSTLEILEAISVIKAGMHAKRTNFLVKHLNDLSNL